MHGLYKWNYWQFGDFLKNRYWRDFKLADFSTIWRETHTCSTNGSIMV